MKTPASAARALGALQEGVRYDSPRLAAQGSAEIKKCKIVVILENFDVALGIVSDYFSLTQNKWSQPDIFTISQMQTDSCLNGDYNFCQTPTYDDCLEVAKHFESIPKKRLIIETKEYGRKTY